MVKEYFGINSLQNIAEILEQEDPSSILLVHGKNSYQHSGAVAVLTRMLRPYTVTEFTGFSSNPQWEEVIRGIELWKSTRPELVIAIGGGSSIDVAKAMTILAQQSGDPLDYLEKRRQFQPNAMPLIAIPTTSGTGSEATHFATIYKDREKYSIAHASLLPDYVIIDPVLTLSLPAYNTACTGMDALTQAIESYWSTKSTKESKQYAAEAITLAVQYLHTAVREPDNIESRTSMARASNLAGKAINISKTTACHAISYPMTSYFNVPHGHAVALTLGEMIIFNDQITERDCNDCRGVDYVRTTMQELYHLLGVKIAKEAKEKVNELMDNIGLQRKLKNFGITTEDDITTIMDHGFHPERVGNNPRMLTTEDAKKILLTIQ